MFVMLSFYNFFLALIFFLFTDIYCGKGKTRVQNRAHGPSPRRENGPLPHQS